MGDTEQSQSEEVHNLSAQTRQCVVCQETSGDMMHGKCFYERFEKERIQAWEENLKTLDEERDAIAVGIDKQAILEIVTSYVEAAKRAAGIDQQVIKQGRNYE